MLVTLLQLIDLFLRTFDLGTIGYNLGLITFLLCHILGTSLRERIEIGNPIIYLFQTLVLFGLMRFILGNKMSQGTIIMDEKRDVLT